MRNSYHVMTSIAIRYDKNDPLPPLIDDSEFVQYSWSGVCVCVCRCVKCV